MTFEITPGDSDILEHGKNAVNEIELLAYYGRKNTEFCIERLMAIIACAEFEINVFKDIQNDKA